MDVFEEEKPKAAKKKTLKKRAVKKTAPKKKLSDEMDIQPSDEKFTSDIANIRTMVPQAPSEEDTTLINPQWNPGDFEDDVAVIENGPSYSDEPELTDQQKQQLQAAIQFMMLPRKTRKHILKKSGYKKPKPEIVTPTENQLKESVKSRRKMRKKAKKKG